MSCTATQQGSVLCACTWDRTEIRNRSSWRVLKKVLKKVRTTILYYQVVTDHDRLHLLSHCDTNLRTPIVCCTEACYFDSLPLPLAYPVWRPLEKGVHGVVRQRIQTIVRWLVFERSQQSASFLRELDALQPTGKDRSQAPHDRQSFYMRATAGTSERCCI